MLNRADALREIAMISANYGNLNLAEAIHEDWFRFLGGHPGEVIFVENGSPLDGQTTLFEGVRKGWITKLLSVRPGTYDIGKHQAYIAEVSALAMATCPLVLLYHLDVLVAQRGHDDWPVEASELLRDPRVFAIGGSFNAPAKHADLDADWYLSRKLSGNFALLPRQRYQESWLQVADDLLRSGFRAEHPLPAPARRFIMEVGLERLLASRDWLTRVRRESTDWSVFHTNLNGEELASARARFLSGEGVAPFLNAGDVPMRDDNEFDVRYFGQRGPSAVKQLRIAIGASPLGPIYRRLLRRTSRPDEAASEPPTLREIAQSRHSPLDELAVVVWVDDPAALAPGLNGLYGALQGRPGQVIALLPADDRAAAQGWQAHLSGCTDKMLVSRSLPVGGGPSLATLVDHGVFAHAHCPSYVLCRASSLLRVAAWLPGAMSRLDGEPSAPIALPDGAPLAQAQATVHRRLALMAEIERETGVPPVVGAAAARYERTPEGTSTRPAAGAA